MNSNSIRSPFIFPSTPLRSASGTPAAWRCAPPSGLSRKVSEFIFPRLRCAPPRVRLRRGAARPLRVSPEKLANLFSLDSAALRLGYACGVALRAPFGSLPKLQSLFFFKQFKKCIDTLHQLTANLRPGPLDEMHRDAPR